MVESTKQVRVDNWGIYFLQRLQLFFSKTDYCDLNLQFEGNVQLKVHRLVMNACTEYFSFLEQTSPSMEENTIMMPPDLQADVIVPIVNFMYTGMLEFHPSIYKKLYQASETMNITVLTKLLDAQGGSLNQTQHKFMNNRSRRTFPSSSVSSPLETNECNPVRKQIPKLSPPIQNEISTILPPTKKIPPWHKRTLTSNSYASTKWNSEILDREQCKQDNDPKPTRFEWPEDDLASMSMYPSFDDVSLTSKPLWTREEEEKAVPSEELLRMAESHDRQQKINESQVESKVEPLSSQETVVQENYGKRKSESNIKSSPKRVKITNHDDETIISITTSNPNEVDHTKIVSEILKRYPDLVKKKKNIKLKITTSKNETFKAQPSKEKVRTVLTPIDKPTPPISISDIKKEPTKGTRGTVNIRGKINTPAYRADSEDGPWTCMECFTEDCVEGAAFVLYYLFRKHMMDHHQMEFDSSLCKYCGKRCPKENLMAYHLYTKHGMKPPRDIAFSMCDMCPYIGVSEEKLYEHRKIHNPDEVQCQTCHLGFKSPKDLTAHQQITQHNKRNVTTMSCPYCIKKLQSPVTLFMHVRQQHMKEARRAGITSLDEVMDVQDEDIDEEEELEEEIVDGTQLDTQEMDKSIAKDRVKILSNVQVERAEPVSESPSMPKTEISALPKTVAVTTTAAALSNIGGSLATNLGIVDIVVLDENQQYILQQPPGQSGTTEFLLPHELASSEGILQAAAASGQLNSTDELVMVLTDNDYHDEQHQQQDNSNIVVLYSHPVEGQEGQFITSQGNILVNSDGVLEIRNGAAITTTAGQLLMSENTTTTQARESPIESIELIRKEIERSDDSQCDRESIKTVLRKKVLAKEINKIMKEPTMEDPQSGVEHNSIDVSGDSETTNQEEVDGQETSLQEEEPMEMDENETEPKTQDQDQGPDIEMRQETVEHTAEQSQLVPIEESSDVKQKEELDEQSHDVPPDSNKGQQIVEEIIEQDIVDMSSENLLILNDPNTSSDTPMEVDGAKMREEELSSLDEVDLCQSTEETPDTSHEIIEESEQEKVQREDNETIDIVSTDIVDEKITEEAINSKETESNKENTVANNDVNPIPFEEFTDESQQSSKSQKKDLNKEILDDWDDTDSQQSQTVENLEDDHITDSVPVQDTNVPANNVNKLMDDWDEEDEEQQKE